MGLALGDEVGEEEGPVGDADGGAVTGSLVGLGVVGRRVGGSDGARIPTSSSMNFLNFRMFKDPRPVTGSHPGAAWKPWTQHVNSAVQLFLPIMISFVKVAEYLYSVGFMKPTGLPPLRSRATLIWEIMPAIMGADTDVPPVSMR